MESSESLTPAPAPPVRTHTGEMCVLDHTGDTKVIWDKHNEAEVEAARATFNSLRKKGYLAYTVTKKGDKGEVITEFDENAERIILSPAVSGG